MAEGTSFCLPPLTIAIIAISQLQVSRVAVRATTESHLDFTGLIFLIGSITTFFAFVGATRIYIGHVCTPAWIADLKDSDPQRRRHSALMLNELGPRTADVMEVLIEAMHDEYVGVRQQASFALGKFGSQGVNAIPILEQALKDDDASVRKNATESLNRIGSRPNLSKP